MEKNINDMPEEEKVEKSETEEETVEDTNETVETEKETTEDTKEDKDKKEAEDKNSSDKKEKKKIFGKKDQQIEELTDKHKRLMAEFQNYRNRSEKEKSAMFEVGARSIIEKLLPIVDNFERGIAALSEEEQKSPTGQGMNLIYKQLMTAFEEMGVTVIEAKGQQFDPELHNAVMHEDNDELEENVVVEEFQKGYKYRDSVIRHSMVKVAN